MKIFISVDIEGITGLCDWSETEHGGNGYEFYRKQMTEEVNACILALKEAGVKDIYVRDAHDSARNLNPADLLPGIKIIRGWQGHPCDMLSGLDEQFDACIFIGYHSPSRSNANPLSHTLNLRHNHIKINNKITSEFHLNAYYAQSLGVPVILVTGDEGLCQIVKNENGNIETVSTKLGLHGAVISRHPHDTLKEIKEKTKQAIEQLKEKVNFSLNMPNTFEIEIQYKNHKQAHIASFYPNAKLISDDEVYYQSDKIKDILTFILFVDK